MKNAFQIQEFNFTSATQRALVSGNFYSILLVARGNVTFSFNNHRHSCGTEDIALMQCGESMQLEYSGGKYPCQIFWIRISPFILQQLSSTDTNLETAFLVVPFHCTIVHASSSITMLVRNLAIRLKNVPAETDLYANDLFQNSLLSMLVIMVLRACIQAEFKRQGSNRPRFMIDEVFTYINEHLLSDITLDTLAAEFFVSKEHIAREFKKQTGQTIHAYIVKSRLELCVRYICEGLPIMEVYRRGGFGSYNHFFTAFKKQYGMTPKEYYKQYR